ncbi:hypothetical protein [Paraburkholderia caballeronis]|uniref:hypothetical protein n=1 Tax=Paraburkholderia caballeronis TaxID=416943 RepID=UPI00141703A3|nr:hypothetical protein [Paraburkholderia caballeronis]
MTDNAWIESLNAATMGRDGAGNGAKENAFAKMDTPPGDVDRKRRRTDDSWLRGQDLNL